MKTLQLLWRNDAPAALPPLAALIAAALLVVALEGASGVALWLAELPIDAIEKVRHIFCPPLLEEFVAALHNSTLAIATSVGILLFPVVFGVARTPTRRQYLV